MMKMVLAIGLLGLATPAMADDYLQDKVRKLELQQRMMQSDLFWQRLTDDTYRPATIYVVPRYIDPNSKPDTSGPTVGYCEETHTIGYGC